MVTQTAMAERLAELDKVLQMDRLRHAADIGTVTRQLDESQQSLLATQRGAQLAAEDAQVVLKTESCIMRAN